MSRRVSVLTSVLLACAAGRGTEWVRFDDFPLGVRDHAMAYDSARRRIVMFGGSTSGYWYGTGGAVADTWEWNGAAWTRGASAPTGPGARQGHAMAFDSVRGFVVLFGGSPDYPQSVLDDTWLYDGQSWVQAPPAPAALAPRWQHAMCFDAARGRTVLFGGKDDSSVDRGDTWEFDGSSWQPVTVPAGGPGAQSGHAMVFDSGRSRSILHGLSGETWEFDGLRWARGATSPSFGWPFGMSYDSRRRRAVLFSADRTFEYDGAVWTMGPPAPATMGMRMDPAIAFDERSGTTLMFSSASSFMGPYAFFLTRDTWLYDGRTWVPGPTASPWQPTCGAPSAAFDQASGRVVMYCDQGTRSDEVWQLERTDWKVIATVPPLLSNATSKRVAYDGIRRVTVVVAGMSAGPPWTVQPWEFDGATFTLGPVLAAAVRSGHAVAFDRQRGRLVVFGGASATFLNDTWEYDGTYWWAGPSAPPGLLPRRGHAMTFDLTRSLTVLFGGQATTGFLNDTWTYDGTGWAPGPAAPPGLSVRHDAGLAPLGASALALFGGRAQAGSFDDTWQLDASGWSPLSTGDAPSPRHSFGFAADEIRESVVLFGGIPSVTSDTWELRGPAVRDIAAGAGHGQPNPNRVRLFTAAGLPMATDFYAYGAGTWGVNTVAGDVDGGSYDEIVTGPGPGAVFGPHVRAFRRTGTPLPISFYAYGTLKYGANVAAGSVDADRFDEIVTGPGPSSVFAPQARAWDVESATPKARLSWFAYPELQYGVATGAGDVDRDGYDEILTAPGPGPALAARVRGWDSDAGAVAAIATLDYVPFAAIGFGARVVAGDADGDGFAEIVATAGPGASVGSAVAGANFDGGAVAPLPGYAGTFFPTAYGSRAGQLDVDGDGADDLLSGAGPDPAADATVKPLAYRSSSLVPLPGTFVAFPGYGFGVNPAGGNFGP